MVGRDIVFVGDEHAFEPENLPQAVVEELTPMTSMLKGPDHNKCKMQFIVDNGVWKEFGQNKNKIC